MPLDHDTTPHHPEGQPASVSLAGGLGRRTFLRLSLGGAAIAVAGPLLVRDPALAQPAPGPFGHGVASGDPLPDGLVIWTRVTPHASATPGSGGGPPTRVGWEVAVDEAFTQVLGSGSVMTSAASDHTVNVDVRGLPPASDVWYRFRALGSTSPIGRGRTAPAAGSAVSSLRMGVVSCSNYEGGYFSAYRHLAARDDLDLVLHLGDYLYEYGPGGYGDGSALGRAHDPANEIVTLEDYRRRHALYKTDPDLAALHACYAMVTTIDDHEVTNNAWESGAENHDGATEGDYAARRAAAMQAYREWMPIRPSGVSDDPAQVYRHLSFGALADVFMLDERTHRSEQVSGIAGDLLVTSPAVADPDRTMLGSAQRAWLEEGLATSTARWKVIGNPVMFAPLVLADLPDIPEVTPALAQVLAGLQLSLPLVINGDQWDGYAAEQAVVRDRFAEAGGVVILTGDIHSSWAAEIPADPGTYIAGGASTAVEFVTPAVTSDSFSAAIGGAGIPGADVLAELLPVVVPVAGPWIKYLDAVQHGFGVFEVTQEAAQFDWQYISDRLDPMATLVPGPSWRTVAGSNRLERTTPLGQRPRSAAAVPSVLPSAAEGTRTGTAPVAVSLDRASEVAARGAGLPATGAAVPTAAAGAGLAAALAARAALRRSASGQPTVDAGVEVAR